MKTDWKLSLYNSNDYRRSQVEPMQNPAKSTTRIECWNDLWDKKSTDSHGSNITLTTRSAKNANLTVLP